MNNHTGYTPHRTKSESSVLQRLQHVGNQTMLSLNPGIIQMVPHYNETKTQQIWDTYSGTCTFHFIRKHILGTETGGHTFGLTFMAGLKAAFQAGTVAYHGTDFIYNGHLFSLDDDAEKIHHYIGPAGSH